MNHSNIIGEIIVIYFHCLFYAINTTFIYYKIYCFTCFWTIDTISTHLIHHQQCHCFYSFRLSTFDYRTYWTANLATHTNLTTNSYVLGDKSSQYRLWDTNGILLCDSFHGVMPSKEELLTFDSFPLSSLLVLNITLLRKHATLLRFFLHNFSDITLHYVIQTDMYKNKT